MAFSILRRLYRIFKANANDAVDQLETPGVLARQMVRDFEQQIAKTEDVVAAVIGEQIMLQKQLDDSKRQVDDWHNKAQSAVLANRDDLATAALKHLARYEKDVSLYHHALATVTPKVNDLKNKLAALRDGYEDAKSEVTQLDARAKVANATSKASRILGGLGSNKIDMSAIRRKVDRLEADSAALDSMVKEASGKDLEAEFTKLDTPPVERRLEELKRQMAQGEEHAQ